MLLLVGDGDEHVGERREGLVDGLRLLEAVPRGVGAREAFGACKVAEIELARQLRARLGVARLEVQREDAVGARGAGVHVGGPHGAVSAGHFHDLVDGVCGGDDGWKVGGWEMRSAAEIEEAMRDG